jgi:hypothetical protein
MMNDPLATPSEMAVRLSRTSALIGTEAQPDEKARGLNEDKTKANRLTFNLMGVRIVAILNLMCSVIY